MSASSFDGVSVLVTGGSRGIGRACCEMLARAGARVAVNYRLEKPSADELVGRIRDAGGEAFALAADVSRCEEAEMMVEEVVSRFGGLDVLVNNAGIWKGGRIEEISDGEWSEMIGVNLSGTFHVIRSAVPPMKGRGGSIVNVSSTAGQRGEAGHAHYAATKGAILALTKSLATELAPFGIRVNCVAPGWVDTDMSRDALNGPEGRRIKQTIPLGRPGRPEEIASAVVFVASDLASFMTGSVVSVNGGEVLAG